MYTKLVPVTTLLVLLTLLGGCSQSGPAEMHYGDDQCDHCKMNVADAAFGTQLITDKGKVFRFDSIECLAAFELTQPAMRTGATRWLANINKPGTFVSGKQAVIVRGSNLRSPMGLSLAATESKADAGKLAEETNGEILAWDQVRAYVAEAWDIE